ncbi:MAG: universal stress protein [Verrucomicrobiae bacterium]|nr:universal stress protein [Verrucomicrobiae bacterium]
MTKNLHTPAAPVSERCAQQQLALGWQRILVPVDFTPASVDALKYAARVAAESGASLVVLHVVDCVRGVDDRNLFYGLDEVGEMASRRLAHLAGLMVPSHVPVRVLVQRGKPAREIITAAESLDCQAIILSPHKRSWLARLWDAGVTHHVTQRAPCHVLVYQSPNAGKTEPSYWDLLADQLVEARPESKVAG